MRYYRKCPHCKSNKGFILRYEIGGYGHEIRDFKGNVIGADREEVNDNDHQVQCLNCQKLIETDNVQIH
jgi:hypothetical protein